MDTVIKQTPNIDSRGFGIWTDDDHKAKWNDTYTIEQRLLMSEKPYTQYDIDSELGLNFILDPDEVLHKFKFGGALSMRSGWYITPKDHPTLIVASKLTIIS